MDITPKQFENILRKVIKEENRHLATRKQFDDLNNNIDGLAKAVKDLRDELRVQRVRIKAVKQRVGITY